MLRSKGVAQGMQKLSRFSVHTPSDGSGQKQSINQKHTAMMELTCCCKITAVTCLVSKVFMNMLKGDGWALLCRQGLELILGWRNS